SELAWFFWIILWPVVIERIGMQPSAIDSNRSAIFSAPHAVARRAFFVGVPMLLIRLGNFLYRTAWAISGLLLLDCPAMIFAYSGFAARLTNVADTIATGTSCTAIACLSWLAGRAMGHVLDRM